MADFDAAEKDKPNNPREWGSDGAKTVRGRGRQMVMVVMAIAVLAGFSAVVIYSYDRGKSPDPGAEAPLITADNSPTRVRPKEPGGMKVPDRDKRVFSRINPNENPPRIEQLLPPPEIVMSRPPFDADNLDEKTRRALATEPAAGPGGVENLVPAPPVAKPTAGRGAGPKPKARPRVVGKTKTKPAPAAPAAAKPSVPDSVPRKAAPARQVASTGGGRGWRVQIAASRSAKAARKSWQDIKRRHRDLFGALRLMLVKADLGKGTGKAKGVFYRMQVGPLAGPDAARKLCARVKQRKLGCFVVKP